ncbi:MAG: HAD family hydrolase [Balneolaceae bacterium]|nr:MAG: HAD family hydrolase [Balneolaceae bacterium]
MKHILLFDIDGTLLHVNKLFSKQMFSEISDELNISFDHVKSSSFAGRTDKDIFEELASVHPRSVQFYDELKHLYLEYMKSNLMAEHVSVIDGVYETIHAAVEKGYKVGLCTGNFRETAYVKVQAAGFKDVFEFGGFGCRHADRRHIPLEAHNDFVDKYGYKPNPGDYVVIGDTPNDIRCAKYFGAVSLAVSTGSYSINELEKNQPDILLSDLLNLFEKLDVY